MSCQRLFFSPSKYIVANIEINLFLARTERSGGVGCNSNPNYRLSYGANKRAPPLFAEGDLPIASVCSDYLLSGQFSATESLPSPPRPPAPSVRERLLLETQEGAWDIHRKFTSPGRSWKADARDLDTFGRLIFHFCQSLVRQQVFLKHPFLNMKLRNQCQPVRNFIVTKLIQWRYKTTHFEPAAVWIFRRTKKAKHTPDVKRSNVYWFIPTFRRHSTLPPECWHRRSYTNWNITKTDIRFDGDSQLSSPPSKHTIKNKEARYMLPYFKKK